MQENRTASIPGSVPKYTPLRMNLELSEWRWSWTGEGKRAACRQSCREGSRDEGGVMWMRFRVEEPQVRKESKKT